ncbi:MAG: hypothetical protein GXY85_11655 [Candidatus Brocadiaceae bacterium]|nr:hypothetical protein [Candidatus Brocadiaceae bacterium]
MDNPSLLQMLSRMSEELQTEIDSAAARRDHRAVCRLRALKGVVDTVYIPTTCPAALLVAADAALAAYDGDGEAAWYARALSEAESTRTRQRLSEAVRLLRRARLWPWRGEPANEALLAVIGRSSEEPGDWTPPS